MSAIAYNPFLIGLGLDEDTILSMIDKRIFAIGGSQAGYACQQQYRYKSRNQTGFAHEVCSPSYRLGGLGSPTRKGLPV
jgi:hypothetical protein